MSKLIISVSIFLTIFFVGCMHFDKKQEIKPDISIHKSLQNSEQKLKIRKLEEKKQELELKLKRTQNVYKNLLAKKINTNKILKEEVTLLELKLKRTQSIYKQLMANELKLKKGGH